MKLFAGAGLAVMCGAFVLAAPPQAKNPAPSQAQKPVAADVLLDQALHQEQNEGRLQDAIATYTKVLAAADATRAQKARAQFRIGACYEKLGAAQAAEARKAYEAVVASYGDQNELVAQAVARLRAIGSPATAAGAPAPSEPAARMLWSKPGWFSAELSPDGRMVAFVDEATANLWVRDVASGTDRKLTNIPKERIWSDFPLRARWSPDSSRLAFDWFEQHGNDGTSEIRVINLATGAVTTFEASRAATASTPLDWSPDGTRVLVTLKADVLAWLSVRDGTYTPLVTGSIRGLGFVRVSPDGARIVYGANAGSGRTDGDVFITTSDGRTTSLLAGGPAEDAPVGWTADGLGVLYAGERSGVQGLWLLPVSGHKPAGPPQLVSEVRGAMAGLSRTGRLVYFSGGARFEFRRAAFDLAAGSASQGAEVQTLAGMRLRKMGSYAPDGRHMVYLTSSGNRMQLVLADADGANPKLLPVPFTPVFWVAPAWSSDSRTIFLDGMVDLDQRGVFAVDIASATVSTLVPPFPARGPGVDGLMFVGAAADGKSVYFERNHSDTRQSSIFRRDLATGTDTVIYRTAGAAGIFAGGLSPDRSLFLFLLNPFEDGAGRQLMIVPVNGGEPRIVLRPSGSVNSMAWSPDGRSVVFGDMTSNEKGSSTEVWQVGVDGSNPRKLGASLDMLSGIAVRPNGRELAYVSASRGNQDVWLLENSLPPAVKK